MEVMFTKYTQCLNKYFLKSDFLSKVHFHLFSFKNILLINKYLWIITLLPFSSTNACFAPKWSSSVNSKNKVFFSLEEPCCLSPFMAPFHGNYVSKVKQPRFMSVCTACLKSLYKLVLCRAWFVFTVCKCWINVFGGISSLKKFLAFCGPSWLTF